MCLQFSKLVLSLFSLRLKIFCRPLNHSLFSLLLLLLLLLLLPLSYLTHIFLSIFSCYDTKLPCYCLSLSLFIHSNHPGLMLSGKPDIDVEELRPYVIYQVISWNFLFYKLFTKLCMKSIRTYFA